MNETAIIGDDFTTRGKAERLCDGLVNIVDHRACNRARYQTAVGSIATVGKHFVRRAQAAPFGGLD